MSDTDNMTDNRSELRTNCGQVINQGVQVHTSIGFRSRDEAIERLCQKVFGASPSYPDRHDQPTTAPSDACGRCVELPDQSEADPYEREAAKAAIKVLQRELAEAKFDLQFRRDLYALQSKELAEAREQRDELAEALEMVATHTYADGQCDNGYSPQYVAKQALAAMKGGADD